MLDLEDQRLLVALSASGPCSMNKSPKKNWVEKSGGLPNYICHIAKAVARGGHGTGGAIAIAIGTAKRWAAGGGKVSPSVRAKAGAAVAEWEALKARAHAGHVVKASETTRSMLSVNLANSEDFNTAIVGAAWGEYMEHERNLADVKRRLNEPVSEPDGDEWIKELWNNFVIAQDGDDFYRVPYTVNGTDVEFGDWQPVKVTWTDTTAPADDDDDDDDDDDELDDDAHADLLANMPKPGGYGFYDRPAPAEISAGW